MSGPSTMRAIFSDLQPLHEAGFGKSPSGVIANERQRKSTYVNAVTHWFTTIASHPSGGTGYRVNPNAGREIGVIKNAGLGAGSLMSLDHVDELDFYQWSEGIGGDKAVKVSEAGHVINGIDTVSRQMLSVQAEFELHNPSYRGQIAMVSTGMYTVYTGIVWDFNSATPKITSRQRS